MQFWKDRGKDILALINFDSEVNAMTPIYTAKLGLKIQKNNVSASKIDSFLLKTYDIVIATF